MKYSGKLLKMGQSRCNLLAYIKIRWKFIFFPVTYYLILTGLRPPITQWSYRTMDGVNALGTPSQSSIRKRKFCCRCGPWSQSSQKGTECVAFEEDATSFLTCCFFYLASSVWGAINYFLWLDHFIKSTQMLIGQIQCWINVRLVTINVLQSF